MNRFHPAPARVGRIAAALLALAAGSGCTDPPPLNLLLIVSDTLRADALSCYGGPARTPEICALAQSGALFERAYSNASWTLPSSVAIFTASYPSEYRRARGQGRSELTGGFYAVEDEQTLCAEALVARGYDAVAWLENRVPSRTNALQGFETPVIPEIDDARAQAVERDLGATLPDPRSRRLVPLLEHLLSRPRRPFFLMHWIVDPHAVYRPPERQLGAAGIDVARLRHPLDLLMSLAAGGNPKSGNKPLRALAPSLPLYDRVVLKKLYLAEVESVDERVGLILRALERGGLRNRTLIVFTSDHGEGFGEHGAYLHGRVFFDELVHVPLIVAGPGVAAGTRVAEPVSHVDLMPTLRELLGVDCLRADVRGRSFRPLLQGGGAEAEDRLQYITNSHPLRGDALIQGSYKLLASAAGDRLYDLGSDPNERRDLAPERPELVAEMKASLQELRDEDERRRHERLGAIREADALRMGEETLKELKAIGYVE